MRLTITALVLFVSCISQFSFAQRTDTLKIYNQYSSPLKEKTIRINGNEIITDNNGNVVVTLNSDSLIIEANNHERYSTATNQIPADNKIVLDKHFGWKDLLTPMFYIINGGLWLLLFIVFAETGLFAGFFLPGDSLLFVSGIYSNELVNSIYPINNDYLNLLVLIGLVSLMGIIGNMAGYWFGSRIGHKMYEWKDTLLFKRKYLEQAHDFYEKHGGLAIVGARFLPLVRTFAPIIAGIVKMDKAKFTYYNIVGSIAWVTSMMLGGHFLQKWIYSWFGFDLKSHLEVIVIGIVAVTTAPVVYKMFFSREKSPTLEIGKEIVEEEIKGK